MNRHKCFLCVLPILLAASPSLVQAATLDGGSLSPWWGVPFAAMLLSIALVPVLAPGFWHRHYGKVAALWGLVFAVPFAFAFGLGALWGSFVHALLAEYAPFILLLLALYTVAGGIHVQTRLRATPWVNTGILALGATLASVMGTTGASMLLIRPLLRVNAHRKYRAHTVIFFIFIVSNIGGALTPLGDPPLFLGFLKGVAFFWTLQHLWLEVLLLIVALLLIFRAFDGYLLKREGGSDAVAGMNECAAPSGFAVTGKANFLLLAGVVALVLMSGVWVSDVGFVVYGTTVALPGLVRDFGLLVITLVSVRMTASSVRQANQFTWLPMLEVVKLFAGIFVTIIPVIAMLHAGTHGPFAPVVASVTDASGAPIALMYFWATGVLSSFLDNAPTYLVFFNTAGGDAATLMTTMSGTLAAISAGAVFMGANTYIGNAPNLMVKAIADEQNVRMPGFFGYMLWSALILVPLFILVSLIFYG